MLKRLYHFILQLLNFTPYLLNRSDSGVAKKKVYSRGQHDVSRRHISSGALKVMSRLNQAGYEAYLVGGGVRDLLLGGQPKDFDVATSATPEQVKRLFRGSRIIGRRFRIVHVRMGREMIETTTFRAHHSEGNKRNESSQSDSGMLLRDNVYGDIASDAARRDFTINALYYTIDGFELHDFCNGLHDIKHRTLRMIGDPATRYREDPVRMLRALRFAAKLGFSIEAKTASPIGHHGELLRDISPSRLFDELLKLFMAGSATATFELLRDYDLLRHLLPSTAQHIEHNKSHLKLIQQTMLNTDKRIRAEKRVTPAFIFAALLWPAMLAEQKNLVLKKKMSPLQAQTQAAHKVIADQLAHTAIPKRFTSVMREIWDLQLRLPRRNGNRAERSFEHPRFRAAYDFVLLREETGEDLQGLGSWWTKYQETDAEGRAALQQQLTRSGTRNSKKNRRRAPRKMTDNAAQTHK